MNDDVLLTSVTSRIDQKLLKDVKKRCKKLRMPISKYIRLLMTWDLEVAEMTQDYMTNPHVKNALH